MTQTKKNLYYQIRRLRAKRDKLKGILYSYEAESKFDQEQLNNLKNYVLKVITAQTLVFGTGLIIYLRTKIC
jgi:uncharacterized protein YlxW (UPF0749 family)